MGGIVKREPSAEELQEIRFKLKDFLEENGKG